MSITRRPVPKLGKTGRKMDLGILYCAALRRDCAISLPLAGAATCRPAAPQD